MNKKKSKPSDKKLVLSRESLRRLDKNDLKSIHGAITNTCATCDTGQTTPGGGANSHYTCGCL